MRMVGAPICINGVPGVVSKQEKLGDVEKFRILTAYGPTEVYRDQFEILPPHEAQEMGLRIERVPNAVEGQPHVCKGDGLSPHRPFRTGWFPVSMSRALCTFCPSCGRYYLGIEGGG